MTQITLDTTKEIIEQDIEVQKDSKYLYVLKLTDKDQRKLRMNFIFNNSDIHSEIIFKGVLYNKSSFDFEGILKILKGAKNTNAYLKIDCLLLSERAYARAVPSLEIQEDEVKASHGATIGYLEPSWINYLKSKGLDEKQGEEILVEAFLNV
jgi:Fe-S cluster assembly scaffold protein SufB